MAAAAEEEKTTSDVKEHTSKTSEAVETSKSTDTSLLVFLNSASGGQMGETVHKELSALLPDSQIFNLKEAISKQWAPEDKLKAFRDVPGIKVLICGGDGTMGWILSSIDRMAVSPATFPVAMMPLGTGNDLARSFGWGPGFAQYMLKPSFLETVKGAKPSQLDRWLLSVMPYEPLGDDDKIKATHIPPTFSVHKYSSAIGPPSISLGDRPGGAATGEPRTQKVLRMGRSFSVRLSSIAKAVHEDEMNRSSSQAMQREATSLDSSLKGRASTGASTTSSGMARASSAPHSSLPAFQGSSSAGVFAPSGSKSPPMPTLGEGEAAEVPVAQGTEGAAPASGSVPPAQGDEKQEVGGASDEKVPSAEDGGAGLKQEGPGGGAADELNVSREMAVQTGKGASGGSDAASAGSSAALMKRPPPPRPMPSISVIQRFETWESYDAVFCNYFSFGVDAVAAAAFHAHRREHPELFTSRCRNQMWYARKGFPAAGGVPCGAEPPPLVRQYLDLRVRRKEGAEWESIAIDDSLRGIVVLNLQSYGGGRDLWGTAEGGCTSQQFAKAAPDDKLLEIAGLSSIVKLGCIMGLNKAGVRGHRLCQAAEVELRVKKPIHMQIDGEPWLQAPAKINIQHFGQSTCLRGSS